MGPGIIIPVVVVAVVVPLGLAWARRRFKETAGEGDGQPITAAVRLTSNALRGLPSPPWRVVYEIAGERLGGLEHVVIGPPGIFALVTTMDPMPEQSLDALDAPDRHAIARAAILRGALDDALRRCAMSSDTLLTVHWGAAGAGASPISVDTQPGATAVDGRRIETWAASVGPHDGPPLTAAQVDLAWQTVVTAIGRPDPLARRS